jgi:hypothetical protein
LKNACEPAIEIMFSTAVGAVVPCRYSGCGFNELKAPYAAKVTSDYTGAWRRFDEVSSENRGWPHTRPLSCSYQGIAPATPVAPRRFDVL